MQRLSDRIATPAGAMGALTISGGVTGVSYFWWSAGSAVAVPVAVAGAAAVLAAGAVLVAFGRAVRRRAVRPGWWASVLPAYAMGSFLGLIVAPFAGLDVESGVFLALLLGLPAAIVLAWIALWTVVMVVRSRPRRAAVDGDGGRAVVVTAS